MLPLVAALAAAYALFESRVALSVLTERDVNGSPVWSSSDHFGEIYSLIGMPLLLGLVVFTTLLPIRTRVREFERALPVTMRELVLTRLGLGLFALGVPIAVMTAVLAVDAPSRYRSVLLLAGGNLLMSAALALILIFRWKPTVRRLPLTDTITAGCVGVAIAALPAGFNQPLLAIPYGLLAAVVLVDLRRRAPLEIPADDPPSAPDTRRVDHGSPAGTGTRLGLSPLVFVMLRSVALRPLPMLMLAVALLSAFIPGYSNPWFLIGYPFWMVMVSVKHGLSPLHGLHALPISRDRMLPFLMLPSLIAVALGTGVRGLFFPTPFLSYDVLAASVQLDNGIERANGVEEEEYRLHVEVPPRAWALGLDPRDGGVTAPWGETCEPLRHRLFWGVSSFVYNPYDVAPDNTVRFLSWQLSRALRDVHGLELSADEVLARYLSECNPGDSIGEESWRIPKGAPWGPLPDRDHNRTGGWFLFGVLLWFGACWFALRDPRPLASTCPRWRRRLRTYGLGTLAISALIAISSLALSDRTALLVLGARIHRWLDGALASSPIAWTALLLGLVLACLALLRRRLRRIEVPRRPKTGFVPKEVAIF
ncbi:hypothetical protein [Engelhardtia mirabilis]